MKKRPPPQQLKRLIVLLVAVLAIGSLCFTSPASATSPTWWNSSWSARAELNVATTDAIASGYSVSLTFPHSTYVAATQSLANGNDVRIVRWDGSAWTELDRVLDVQSSWNATTTKLWFRTQSAINASTSDVSYWLYLGNANAGVPPANGGNVFDVWDDFSSPTLNPIWVAREGTTVTAAPSGGELVASGTTDNTDKFFYFGIKTAATSYTSGYLAESSFSIISQSTNAQANWQGRFGIGDSNAAVRSHLSSDKRVQWASGSWNDMGDSTLDAQTFSRQRVATAISPGGTALLWENGVLRGSRTGAFTSPLAVSFAYDVNLASATFEVRYDDVLIRKFANFEPVVTMTGVDGAESMNVVAVQVDPSLSFLVSGLNGDCNGLVNTIGAGATSTSLSLNHVSTGVRTAGAQQLSISTNAANGAYVKLKSTSASSPVLTRNGDPSDGIDDTSGGALPAATTEAFGYTTDDTEVAMPSGNVGPVPNASSSVNVMSLSAGVMNRTSCVGYFVSVSSATSAGQYETTVVYTAIPSY